MASWIVAGAIIGAAAPRGQAQHVDVLTQVVDGKIAIGAADYDTNSWTIGQRVFQRQLLSNFRSNEPGFTGLTTGNPLLPGGVSGFPADREVFFDLLPMRIGETRANLFFWDGADVGGDGVSPEDVRFVVLTPGITWNLFDANFNVFTVDGADAVVPGGLVQRTSSDSRPDDGVDTGSLHNHLLIRVDDGDGNGQTSPPQGVYLAALQLRAAGFEASDPFLFVHPTSTLSNVVRNAAAAWADENYDSLFTAVGDFDLDGDADGDDFLVWQREFGASGEQSADGNRDGSVDSSDFELWSARFGASAATPGGALHATPLPEHASLALAIAALANSVGRRRRVDRAAQGSLPLAR